VTTHTTRSLPLLGSVLSPQRLSQTASVPAIALHLEDEDLNPEAAKAEREAQIEAGGDEQPKTAPKAKKKKPKGKVFTRQSPLAIGRAVSLRPYRGELSFNAAVRKEGEKKSKTTDEEGVEGATGLSLYNAEMHTTEYQYSFGLNLDDVVKKENIGHLIDAIFDPPQVGGNHARFAYDFSPASIVLRVTNAHSSRIQNCFEHDDETRGYHVNRLVSRVKNDDIPAKELIIGGELASSDEGANLKELGASVYPGVRAALNEAKRRIADLDESFKTIESDTNGKKQSKR
jgi:CRISPR-associated protein Cst2